MFDYDLEAMPKEILIEEVKKLREGIRKHRDAEGHNLCWFVPELWYLLPEKQLSILNPIHGESKIPSWCEFMQNCAAYRASLDNK